MNERMNPAALHALLRGDFVNAAIAQTPGGIEAQEAAAQQELLVEQKLPKEGSIVQYSDYSQPVQPKEKLESLGFVFGGEIDDLFIACTLPQGWHIQLTSETRWSELRDQQGRKRGVIFYKGAFYDRRAFLRMLPRFHVEEWHAATPEQPEDRVSEHTHEEWKALRRCCVVKDCDGTILFHTASYTNANRTQRVQAEQNCRTWLFDQYPLSHDPFAYWEKA